MSANTSVIDLLDFSKGVCDLISDKPESPVKRHFLRQAKDLSFNIDKIYFSGEYPSVYFKTVPNFLPEIEQDILAIHKSIWNQGKVPFLYVESPTEIRIYNCYERPIHNKESKRSINNLTLFKASKQVEADMQELKLVFDKISIDTGQFWQQIKYSEQVKYQNRVEQALVDNLKRTREKLEAKGLGIDIIHDLLLRSLFLLYLEDRGGTDVVFYQVYKSDAKSYFDILEDKEATYKLFRKLEDSFNGNLCPVTDSEDAQVNTTHLALLKECFWSSLQEGNQLRLFDWRVFNFRIIPIELISSIYEDFLAKEDGEDKQAKSGAYYTPRPLAEFILNHVLPYPSVSDCKYNIKILDPTCGSGIFLVESLNRLLDRWQMAHPHQELDFDTIQNIVLDNIHGVEKEKEALKVAAFSIYLAMLNRLEPKLLWQEKKFPYLIYDPDNQDTDKQGRNLFRMSSLDKGAFEDIEYDLVVGNPPFKRGNLDTDVDAYLDEKGFAKETVLAFLHRATALCKNGKIALVFPAKILFNTGTPYQKFRYFLFNDTYVEQVYNFAILRRTPKGEGGNLFASAVSPVGVFIYSKAFPKTPSDKVMYCAPKSVIKNRLIDGIAIDSTDIKYLPRIECQKTDTIIWKAAMWGTERDFSLLKDIEKDNDLSALLKSIGADKNKGVGFQTSLPHDHTNIDIKQMPHIEAENVERYYSPLSNTNRISNTTFFRLGNTISYQKPHLLIKEGLSNKRFCASFIDYDCSFKKTIYGIHIPNDNDNILKLLTAFLNSSLASYLMFLKPSSWGVERERVKPNEILTLPDLITELSNDVKESIILSIDTIIGIKKNDFENKEAIKTLEKQIDNLFYDGLSLTANQKVLIEDLIQFNLDAFQEKNNSIAYYPCVMSDTSIYAEYLIKTLNGFLKFGTSLTAWSSVFQLSPKTPLNLIAIHLNNEHSASYIEENTEAEINQILKEIEVYTYQKHSESIYYRRFIKYYKDDIIYIIKPNEKRFWSRSLALNDADEIIAEITTAQTDERTTQQ